MSDILWGVIIGGIIASITPVITLIINDRKWKKESKINRLKQKRDKLEAVYKSSFEKLIDGSQKDLFSIDMISDFDYLFPEEVRQAFENYMKDKDRSHEKHNSHIYSISRAMKKSLSKIDDLIDLELEMHQKKTNQKTTNG